MANILLVDNEKVLLIALQEELEKAGHNVKTALNALDAIELIKKENFNIVYTDLIMPKMNGVELCKKIKEISNKTQVVLFSGHPEELPKHIDAFTKYGGRKENLKKPLKDNELIKYTENLLNEILKSETL